MMRAAYSLALALAATTAAPALAEDPGAQVFAEVCAACHGAAGEGTPGMAPPLADPPLWERLGDKAPQFVAGVLVSGLSGTIMSQGQGYYGLVMPSQAALSDDELAAVASHVIRTYSGEDRPVAPADIAAARDALPSHTALMALRGGGGE